jgi:hypothetical protein
VLVGKPGSRAWKFSAVLIKGFTLIGVFYGGRKSLGLEISSKRPKPETVYKAKK